MMEVDEGAFIPNTISSVTPTTESEDVYMRPVFNELQLPNEVSFVDLTKSEESLRSRIYSDQTASSPCSQIIVVVDTCVLISKLKRIEEWRNRWTEDGVVLFLPWTVLQVTFTQVF